VSAQPPTLQRCPALTPLVLKVWALGCRGSWFRVRLLAQPDSRASAATPARSVDDEECVKFSYK